MRPGAVDQLSRARISRTASAAAQADGRAAKVWNITSKPASAIGGTISRVA